MYTLHSNFVPLNSLQQPSLPKKKTWQGYCVQAVKQSGCIDGTFLYYFVRGLRRLDVLSFFNSKKTPFVLSFSWLGVAHEGKAGQKYIHR